MLVYQVGKPYNPNRKSWPEGHQYNYRGGGHELLLFYPRPSPAEVRAVREGAAEFAALELPPAIIFLYKFGDSPWSDTTFSYHLVSPGERTIPPERTGEERELLTTLLVDAADGIVMAIRAATFSPEFTRELHEMITRNAAGEWGGEAAYVQTLENIYDTHPTTESFLTAPGVVRTRGGA